MHPEYTREEGREAINELWQALIKFTTLGDKKGQECNIPQVEQLKKELDALTPLFMAADESLQDAYYLAEVEVRSVHNVWVKAGEVQRVEDAARHYAQTNFISSIGGEDHLSAEFGEVRILESRDFKEWDSQFSPDIEI